MIQVEKLTYSFPEKDLYKNISFTLQDGAHCALIGSNGTGECISLPVYRHDGILG